MNFIKKHDLIQRSLSVVVAILMWMYVIADKNPSQTKKYSDIGVQMIGIEHLQEDGLSIISGADAKVEVNLRGKREKMLQVYADKISATVNLSSITAPGEYKLAYTVLVEVDGVTVIHKVPEQILLVVDRVVTKSVPVELTVNGTVPQGFTAGDAILSPDAITIKGPESVLQNVEYAKAVINVSEMKQTTSTTVPVELVNADGKHTDMSLVTMSKPAVDITIPVHQAGQVPFIVNIDGITGITMEIPYTVSPANILLSGAPDVIEKLNNINLGSIDAAAMLAAGTTEVTLPVVLPNGVSADNPVASVVVKLDFSSIKQKTFTIQADRFTEQAGFSYISDQLEIQVFGLENELNALTSESFVVNFDAAAVVENGSHKVAAIITHNAKNVTLLKKYQIEVNREIQ